MKVKTSKELEEIRKLIREWFEKNEERGLCPACLANFIVMDPKTKKPVDGSIITAESDCKEDLLLFLLNSLLGELPKVFYRFLKTTRFAPMPKSSQITH